MRAVEDDDQV